MSKSRAAAVALAALFALPFAARAELADGGTRAPSAPAAATSIAADDDDLAAALAPFDPANESNRKEKAGERGAILEELSTLQPGSTDGNPTGPSYSNNLTGIINLNDKWSLDLGFLFTVDKGAAPPPGSNFPDSGGHVSLFTVGADWDSGDHWSFDVLTDLSPKSTTNSSTTLVTQLNPDGGPVLTSADGGTPAADTLTDARLDVVSSNADLQVGFGYDTNGDSNAEWLFVGSLTGGALDTTQKVTAVQIRSTGRTVSAAALDTYCAAHPRICGTQLTSALGDRDYKLDSAKLELGATLTLFDDTDLSITGDYFLYAQDPAGVGYFDTAIAGRSLSGGAGVPLAPLRVDGRLDLLHRFGNFSLKIWGTAGEYAVDSDGATYGAGIKAQYKFSRTFRIWLGGSLQHDIDDTGDDFVTWGVSAGIGVRF